MVGWMGGWDEFCWLRNMIYVWMLGKEMQCNGLVGSAGRPKGQKDFIYGHGVILLLLWIYGS